MPTTPQKLGAYELIAPLATGGMAELFVAKTAGVSGFEKQVALKVIHPNFSSDPDFVHMLVDEAKLAVQLQHMNIVQTYDLGQVDGQYYIVMELIDGADLYKVLKTASEQGLEFPVDVAAHITSEVATGLDYAHRKNDPMGRPLKIVHRDISPQNVLVSREGEIKIVDFGIAKAALRNQQTQAGVIKGKYFYMSPEQAWGAKIDARTDVFSTGILLHEMLAGEMLYLEDDLERLLEMVRSANVQPPSRKRRGIPSELDAIVMKALAKRPEDRFQTAADLSNALVRFLRTHQADSGRARVARFVRQVLEREPSRADIRIEPAVREDFADENSVIFDLNQVEAAGSSDAARKEAQRRSDEPTRGEGVLFRPPPLSDYENGGVTEYDPRPTAPLRFESGESEPTSLAIGKQRPNRGFAPQSDDADDEFTRPHVPAPAPGLRRPSSPAPHGSHQSLPPIASPPPAPRAAMGLGVRDSRAPSIDTGMMTELAELAQVEPKPRFGPAFEPTLPASELERRERSPAPPARPRSGDALSPSAAQWDLPPTTTPSSAGLRNTDPVSSTNTQLPDRSRRKRVLLAGTLAFVSLIILSVAVMWPDGPTHGAIEVVSSPPGATVRIDGTVASRLTPLRIEDIDVRQPHRLSVSLRGYETWDSDAKFEGDSRELRMQAVLVPTAGTLDVSTAPQGAEVIVNGRSGGLTPVRVGDLPPNEDVTLELRLRGYKVVYKTLSWEGKRALSVSIPLEKAH